MNMTERDQVMADLRAAVTEVLGEEAPEFDESTIIGDGTIDSLDLVEIVMALEDRRDIVVEGDAVNEIATIGGLVDLVLALDGDA
jgi:acyl carrier protein